MDNNKYLRYSLKTLEKWLSTTETQLYEESKKSHGHWGDGMRLSKLPEFKRWNNLRDKVSSLKEAIKLKKQLPYENNEVSL